MTGRRLSLILATCAVALAHAIVAAANASAETQPAKPTTSSQPPASSPPTAQPPAEVAPGPPADVVLSDERTLTTWAHALEPVPIYSRPDTHARRVDHLHMETEDGFEEVYLLLVRHLDADGRVWVKLRIP